MNVFTFPFYNSDMLPFGNNRTVYNDTVINPNLKQFDLPAVFNDNILGKFFITLSVTL